MEEMRCYGCMNLKRGRPVCEHCGFDERWQNAPHQLPIGTVLQGHYAVGRVLGQGGFGITYLGLDTTLDIPVAIKEYYPGDMVSRESSVSHGVSLSVADCAAQFAENRDRFLREARILARLESVPEVVQVKNFFTQNNTAYIVMGYVRGITLKEYLRRRGGRLPAGELFRLLKPLLGALDLVHKAGLVHRDISPDNIMITPEGQVRLIDFGAAHAATNAGDRSTQAVLKHGFAPPEQYQRKGQLGPWTDVYAICATVYHCLTGEMPPTATDRMLGEEEFRWDALTGLNEVQRAALQQGLAIQQRARLQSMEELSERLILEPTSLPKASQRGTIALGYQTNTSTNNSPIYTAPVDYPFAEKSSNDKNAVQPKRDTLSKRKSWIFQIALPLLCVILIALLIFTQIPMLQNITKYTGSRVLMVHNDLEESAFRTGVDRSKINSITFMNTTSIPSNAVDASEYQDGSVFAWVTYSNSKYHLYIAANGTIIAPENCSRMFQNFTQLKHISLNRLDTTNVTNMSYMFYNCSGLTNLDISAINTQNVTNVDFMFYNTHLLGNATGKLDFESISSYQHFMDKNDTFNSRAWKTLFP